MYKNGIPAPCFMKGYTDFDQIFKYIMGTWTRTDYILVTLTHFQGRAKSQNIEKWLVCTLSPEGTGGF